MRNLNKSRSLLGLILLLSILAVAVVPAYAGSYGWYWWNQQKNWGYQPPANQTPTPDPAPSPTPTPQPSEPTSENPSTKPPIYPATGLTAEEQRLVNLINQERAAAGRQAVRVNLLLTGAARAKAKDIADLGYFSHYSPTYGHPEDMLRYAGVSYIYTAENIARLSSSSTVDDVHRAFMNSSGHRTNILSFLFTEVGVGVVRDKYGRIVVAEEFIKPR